MAIEVKVPVLGESITEATLGEWLKQPGDAVAADEPIASLETDKVALEVPAPQAGVMGAYQVEVGDTVEVGAVIATIEAGSGAAPAAKSAPAPAKAEAKPDETDASITLSPSVRRLVLEHGVDPSQISGTGKDGRLTKADVEQYVKSGAQQAPLAEKGEAKGAQAPSAPSSAGNRNEERVRMTRLRQTVARRLKDAQDSRSFADHVQRCRHDRGDRDAEQIQGSVRQEAWREARLHGLFRQGGLSGAERRAFGQRADRWRGDRLSRLCRYFRRGERAHRSGGSGYPRCRSDELCRCSKRRSAISASAPRTAR